MNKIGTIISAYLIIIQKYKFMKYENIVEQRRSLKEQLPHGYSKIVAQRAKVSQKMVCDFFAGRRNSVKVELATLEILAELSQKKKHLLEQIN